MYFYEAKVLLRFNLLTLRNQNKM